MGAATEWLRTPLGPFTVTVLCSSVTSTPEGTGTGSLPMRDIAVSSCSRVTRRRRGLPHLRPPGGPLFQLEREGPADGGLALRVDVVGDLPGGDVTLLLEDLRDACLQLAVGHGDRVVVRLVGVAQTGQHVCDRVSHGHGVCVLSRSGFGPWVDVRPATYWVVR